MDFHRPRIKALIEAGADLLVRDNSVFDRNTGACKTARISNITAGLVLQLKMKGIFRKAMRLQIA
jgi:hypothetical protein